MSNSPFASLLVLPSEDLPRFVNKDPRYLCPICKEIVRGPVQTSCGHRTCKSCMDSYLAEHGKNGEAPCPVGDPNCEPVSQETIYPDFSGKKEVESLAVFCNYHEFGCMEHVQWRSLKRHSDTCRFKPADCPFKEFGCPERILDQDYEEHRRSCKYRTEKCGYCNVHVPQVLMEQHLDNACPKVQVPCPNKCGEQSLLRVEMGEHLMVCPAKPEDCPFSSIGCSFQGSKDDIARHRKMATQEHLELQEKHSLAQQRELNELRPRLGRLEAELVDAYRQIEVLNKVKEKNDKHIREMKKNMAVQNEKIIELIEKVEECANAEAVKQQGRDLKALMDGQAKQEQRLTKVERDAEKTQGGSIVGGMSEELRNQIIRHDKQVSIHDLRLRDMEMRFQCIETTSYDGTLIWKIKEYSRRKQEAMTGRTLSLYSQPFYTSRYGYKMCARVYLNGDGIGKGSHMSLFFVLMHGDYDPLLSWPFRQKVIFTLLDQESGKKHMQDTFRPDPTSSSFRRPQNEMNVATGCPLFVAHTVIESRPYLIDDTIYIKVSVEPSVHSAP